MILAVTVSILLNVGLLWLAIKIFREQCFSCHRFDWVIRMRAYQSWLDTEDQPRISYRHRHACRRGRFLWLR